MSTTGPWYQVVTTIMALTLALVIGLSAGSAAQTTAGGLPEPGSTTPREPPPGRFHIGPFYLTPTLHVGTIGLDTNVFYTATERQTDVSASGGPGLELVLPLGGSGRFFANGNIDYLYFVRTQSQRRLRGGAAAGFDFRGSRTWSHLEEVYTQAFGRPSYEVDERLSQTEESTRLDLKRRLFGRIAIRVLGRRARLETDQGASYLGNNLTNTLTRDEYRAGGGLDYTITVKTSLVVEGDQEWDRFPLDQGRDADSNRLWVGFRTGPTALISGQALAGFRWFRPKSTPGFELRRTIADVNATWNISPKTSLNAHYGRDFDFSAFETSGPTSSVFYERYGIRIDKTLVGNFDVRIHGRITTFLTDGNITVDIPDEGPVTAVRSDKAREAGIDLGYRFRPRFRVGVVATYVERNSNISYFGIDGLLIGASVQFTP